ncbi:MAG: hypothetical protein H6711_28445 [Myxococcales bacterium]|nr:hypothetical protein [Myxococcales bacterium]
MLGTEKRPQTAVTAALSAVIALTLAACGEPATSQPPPRQGAGAPAQAAAELSDEALAERYNAAKARTAELDTQNALAVKGAVNELGPQLREIADKARDPHLRANASLLLGSLHELAGDRRAAIAFYRQASGLVPKEIEPVRVLALALGAEGAFKEAAELQDRVVADDMDDLAAWLLLGELRIKAGDVDGAKEAYVAYEIRRKGLIDGLTLRQEGAFIKAPEERAGCAVALTPAADNGTAMALLYALKYEPDPKVRASIAETMGIQRLAGYKEALSERLGIEPDPAVKEVLQWALDEIGRDPLETRPGAPPELLAGEEAGSADDATPPAAPAEDAPAEGAPAEGASAGTPAAPPDPP